MKNIKLLGVFLCLVTVIAAIVLLYRRTNVLLSHYENVTRDLNSVKSFLTKNVKPPGAKSTGGVTGRTASQQRVPQPATVQKTFDKTILEKKINNAEPFGKIKNTQNNIADLRASIEAMEDMISSSSGYSSEEADDESSDSVNEVAALSQLQKPGKENNLESYDLADVENENSELEDLINSNSVQESSNLVDTESLVSNPQESAELNNKNISEEVTADIILNTYSKRTLENLCANEYLSKSGNKAILVQRLLDNGHDFNKKDESVTTETVSSN